MLQNFQERAKATILKSYSSNKGSMHWMGYRKDQNFVPNPCVSEFLKLWSVCFLIKTIYLRNWGGRRKYQSQFWHGKFKIKPPTHTESGKGLDFFLSTSHILVAFSQGRKDKADTSNCFYKNMNYFKRIRPAGQNHFPIY